MIAHPPSTSEHRRKLSCGLIKCWWNLGWIPSWDLQHCARNIQVLPTLKTAQELKHEIYYLSLPLPPSRPPSPSLPLSSHSHNLSLSLSTLTETAGVQVQALVEQVWDVADWYSEFRQPNAHEIWARKVRKKYRKFIIRMNSTHVQCDSKSDTGNNRNYILMGSIPLCS
jgi:hypothetical protein